MSEELEAKPRNYAEQIRQYRAAHGCSLKEARDAIDAGRRTPPADAPQAAGGMDANMLQVVEESRVEIGSRWKHKKRGTFYVVTGVARLQCMNDALDGAALIIYVGDNGNKWARPYTEFIDGRFERASPPAAPADDAREWPDWIEDELQASYDTDGLFVAESAGDHDPVIYLSAAQSIVQEAAEKFATPPPKDADEAVVRDAKRYRWLLANCSQSYGMGSDSPAECTIHFDWQQSKPSESSWGVNEAIDAALAALAAQSRAGKP